MKGVLKQMAKKALKDEFDPKTYYHATMEDIDVFNPRQINVMDLYNENPKPRGATYFSSSPEYVNSYLDEYFDITNPNQYETGARIYPVKIKTKDLFDYQNEDHKKKLKNQLMEDFSEESRAIDLFEDAKEGNWFALENEDIQETLKKLGFSGYKSNEPGTVGLFYPDKGDVRGVFAKFDPKDEKKGEILATVVPYASVATFGSLAGLEEGT